MGISEDITDRKRVEERMLIQDRIFQSVSQAIIITNASQPDNPIIHCNPAFEEITGYSRDEIIGRSCRFLHNDDNDQQGIKELRKAIEEERRCTVVLRNYKKDGTLFWNELTMSPVRDELGQLTHFVDIINDITQHKETEKVLQKAHDELELKVRERTADFAKANGALLIQNAERKRAEEELNKRNTDLEILNAITHAVNHYFDLEEIYRVALDKVIEQDYVDLACIYLVYEARNEAVLQDHRNFPDDYLRRASRIPYPKGATWKVIKSGKTLNVKNAQQGPDVGPAGKELGFRSMLGIPIASEGVTLGVIWLLSYKEHLFTKPEVALLTSIGTQIAVAIAKAKLYKELTKKNRYEKIISTVTQSVHQSIDLQEVLENAVEAMNQNIDKVEYIGIYLVEGQELVLRANIGFTDRYIERAGRIAYPKGFTWRTIIDGKPRYCPDVDKDEIIGPAGRELGIKSYLSMPIRIAGKTVGVTAINSSRKNAFDEEELKLLEVVAHQIEVAINNAEQAEVLRRSEDALKESLDRLTKKNRYEKIISTVTQSVHQSIDLQEVLENAVEAISMNIDVAANVAIFLVEGEEAVLKSYRGLPEWFVKRVRKIPYPKGYTWKTIIDGKPRYCPDVDKDTVIGPAGKEVGTKSYVSMSIKYQDKTVGCINVHSFHKNAFDEEELRLLEIVAHQIETAINNAKQSELIQQSEERFRLIVEASPNAMIMVGHDGKIKLVNHPTEKLFGYDREELIGETLEILLPERFRNKHLEFRTGYYKNPQARPMGLGRDLFALRKDGSEIPVEISLSPVQTNEGPMVLSTLVDITERKRAELELKNAFSEIERLKDRLERENIYLKEEIDLQYRHGEIVGKSEAIKKVLSQVEQVAMTESTVLLQGETGTGKELLAREIHNLSSLSARAMVKVDCTVMPPNLVESELFGHEKGSFTGAFSRQIGRFEVADGTTIFLDEIAELTLDIQAKLLRVIQEGRFERIGSNKTINVDVRIIAASNKDLTKCVMKGSFREDLYHRLNVFPILVPPLRDRKSDILLLVQFFINEFAKSMGKQIEIVQKKSMEALIGYSWPGNIRELRNIIERAMIISKGKTLNIELPGVKHRKSIKVANIREHEKNYILDVLEMTEWRIRGKGGAAEILAIKPTTLESRMLKLGIERSP
ncbi:MAG: sigma 54-interacting transcriptional regulator [Thermodesulfobacteriota bacterium]